MEQQFEMVGHIVGPKELAHLVHADLIGVVLAVGTLEHRAVPKPMGGGRLLFSIAHGTMLPPWTIASTGSSKLSR